MAEIKEVGVIGAGQMGIGIAHVFASAGYIVVLHDIDPGSLEKALTKIDSNLNRQAAKGKIDQTAIISTLSRLTPTPTIEAFANSDLVIEAATENQDIKTEIFKKLSGVMKKRRHYVNQHLVDFNYRPRRCYHPAGQVYRPAFHEPGPGHEAG